MIARSFIQSSLEDFQGCHTIPLDIVLHGLTVLRGKWFECLSFNFVPVSAMHHHKESFSNFWMICNNPSKAVLYPGWRNWSSMLSFLGKFFRSLLLSGLLCSPLSRFSLYWGDKSWVQYLGVLWRAFRQGGTISSLYLQAVVLLEQPCRPIVFAAKSHIPLTVQQEPQSLFCSPSAPVLLPPPSPTLNQRL